MKNKMINAVIIMNVITVFFMIGFLFVGFLGSITAKSVDVVPNLPAFGDVAGQKLGFGAIVQLEKSGSRFCSGVVIDRNYILTAQHCIVVKGKPTSELIKVRKADGSYTGIVAKAVGVNNRVDIGLIQGDFSELERLDVDFYNFTAYGYHEKFQGYISCGFPYLQNHVSCTSFFPQTNWGFSIAGQGFAIPGMSGGPVIDLTTNKVIAINSAMLDGYYIVAPTLGTLGAFGIEPQ